MKNLGPNVTSSKELEKIFNGIGSITSAYLQIDAEGTSKGFGFVNFKNPHEAVRAVADLHGKEHDGKKLYVAKALKKGERAEELKKLHHGRNVYIENLDPNIDEDQLRVLFKGYGKIENIKVLRNQGVSRGIALVDYSTEAEAGEAVEKMKNKKLGLQNQPIYVSIAWPPRDKSRTKSSNRESQLEGKQSPGKKSIAKNSTSTGGKDN